MIVWAFNFQTIKRMTGFFMIHPSGCLLYTSDAADDMQCVDLGGRRIIKKNSHMSVVR